MKILVTGGCGFIGSHTVVELLDRNYEVVIVDNFYNSQRDVLDKIKIITNKEFDFYEADCCDYEAMCKIFKEHKIDAVIHFAGYKAVGESVSKPIMYYQNNLDSTLVLLKAMKKYDCHKIVFSSSATVYGDPASLPIKEDFPLSTTNPYGTTKLFIERILSDCAFADPQLGVVLLRYFNPIGAHQSGLIGESPNDIPNNLMPYIMKVATKELPQVNVFGNDYDTIDGTGVRDYIHVVDLALGHIKAIEKIKNETGVLTYNLGTGKGTSVLELIEATARINHLDIPYVITARRPGDIAACYADPTKAKVELGWVAEKTIDDMCKDAYHFVKKAKGL
ncbi:MAG: UDP-glucose 4-epimerase GalE [Traorella sp.]